MDELMRRFVEQAPVAVMVRATLARALADSTLDELFARTAQAQYTKELALGPLEDVAEAILFIAGLPERVVIPELVITPAGYTYV